MTRRGEPGPALRGTRYWAVPAGQGRRGAHVGPLKDRSIRVRRPRSSPSTRSRCSTTETRGARGSLLPLPPRRRGLSPVARTPEDRRWRRRRRQGVGTNRPGISMLLPPTGMRGSGSGARPGVRRSSKRNCRARVLVTVGVPVTPTPSGTFDLSTILAGGALPPWYGTGVTPPAGHDGYFSSSTNGTYIKFLVLGDGSTSGSTGRSHERSSPTSRFTRRRRGLDRRLGDRGPRRDRAIPRANRRRSRNFFAPVTTPRLGSMATVERTPDTELLLRLRVARSRSLGGDLRRVSAASPRVRVPPRGERPRRRRPRAGDVRPSRPAPRPARPGDSGPRRVPVHHLQEPLPEAGREARSGSSRWRTCPSRSPRRRSRTTPNGEPPAGAAGRGTNREREARLGSASCWRCASSRTGRTPRSASSST